VELYGGGFHVYTGKCGAMADNQDDSFNASKAEVFEALGHPTRIRLLQCLGEKPLPFSELKRAAGLESNGLLSFHLGKLGGLVMLNPEGAYALTDEGREALRMIEASRTTNFERTSSRPVLHLPRQRAVVAGLIAVLIVLGSVAVYQQEQITALNHDISSNAVTIGGVRYWHLSEPLQSVLSAKSVVFEGVNFTAVSPNLPLTAGTAVSFANTTMYPALNTTSFGVHYFTFLPEISVNTGTESIAYWNPFTVTLLGTPASIGSAPNIVNITFTNPPAGTWFCPHDHPTAGIGWDESTGIMTFYVSVS
jgi:DNA-binding transcriptional ArsR family regulator